MNSTSRIAEGFDSFERGLRLTVEDLRRLVKTNLREVLSVNKLRKLPSNGIVPEGFDKPVSARGKNCILTAATDKGIDYKDWNEDAVVIVPDHDAGAVIDGMGGMGKTGSGKEAARILGETIRDGFRKGASPSQSQRTAAARMNREGLGTGGACYVSWQLKGNAQSRELEVAQAGDCRLVVFGADGSIKFSTTDESQMVDIGGRSIETVTNAVGGDDPGITTLNRVSVTRGDRIVAGSDGIWKNIPVEYMARYLAGKTSAEAVHVIRYVLDQMMTPDKAGNKRGKSDNRSVAIVDVL